MYGFVDCAHDSLAVYIDLNPSDRNTANLRIP